MWGDLISFIIDMLQFYLWADDSKDKRRKKQKKKTKQ